MRRISVFKLLLLWLLLASSLQAANVRWIGAAQDVAQVDTITIAGTWAGGDTLTVTCNNKSVVMTSGSTVDTTAEVAAALAEVLVSNSHDPANLTADVTINAGGYEYGEFRDLEVEVSGSVVTVMSRTAGVPFTISVSETAAGTATHVASATAATGKHHFDAAKNWEGGALPGAADTIIFDSGDVDVLYGLANSTLDLELVRKRGYRGSIGLPPVNITHAGYHYAEYRTQFLKQEPSTSSTTVDSRIEAGPRSGHTYLDYGSNVPTTFKVTIVSTSGATDQGPAVQIVGGKALQVVTYDGSISIGDADGQTATELKTLKTLGKADVRVGSNTTFVNVSGSIVHNSGELELHADCNGSSNDLMIYGGTLRVMTTSRLNDVSIYGGRVDYRGSVTNTLYGYGGEYDATLCPSSTMINTIEVFRGFTFKDPNNVFNQGIDLNGCTLSEVNLVLKKNLRLTLGAPASVVIAGELD